MFISVTLLCEGGKRLTAFAIKAQTPMTGWLHYEIKTFGPYRREKVAARLVNEAGDDLLAPLDFARLIACRGRTGALIEGVEYRRKGTKHEIRDRQGWWCEAPPRTGPLIDNHARVLAAERRYVARWGDD
jgi:hypothetical protein